MNVFLALDVGERRIGVALANSVARLANPLTTLINDDDFLPKLAQIVAENNVTHIVVGLPRNMSGDDTSQTEYVRRFAKTIAGRAPNVVLSFQDEAATSVIAEKMLNERGKPYQKADIDAYAAAIILEDFLQEQGN